MMLATILLTAHTVGGAGFQHPGTLQVCLLFYPLSIHLLLFLCCFLLFSLSSDFHSRPLHCSSPALIDISLPSPKQTLFLSPNVQHVRSTLLSRREQSAGELVSRYIINALAPVLGIHLFFAKYAVKTSSSLEGEKQIHSQAR